jgi:predicted nicotinamide N-methyase
LSLELKFDYPLERVEVKIGAFSILLDCIVDFEQTIDRMFADLSQRDQGHLLNDLCPYFGAVWPSSLGLLEVMTLRSTAESWRMRRVLELGCGLAIPSLWLKSLGADITASDMHPDVPVFLERNRQLNHLGPIPYQVLDWRSEEIEIKDVDVIIASDVLYEKEFPLRFACFLKKNLPPGGEYWLADPGRAYLQDFVTAAEEFSEILETLVQPTEFKGQKQEVFVIHGRKG